MSEGMMRKATVIDGRVEIEGTTYYPCQQWARYDGSLDGKECWFITYSFGVYVCFYGVEGDSTHYPWEWWWTKKEVGNAQV